VLIAAVAVAHGLPLCTCNPSDVAGMSKLTLVVVPHPTPPDRTAVGMADNREPSARAQRAPSRTRRRSRAGRGGHIGDDL